MPAGKLQVGGGAKWILLAPIVALYSAVFKIQNLFSSHEGFLIYAKYHHRETIFQVLTEVELQII